jgi:hypothetical protein
MGGSKKGKGSFNTETQRHREERRRSGRVAEWQSGRVAEWQSGRVAEWQSGRVATIVFAAWRFQRSLVF